jgi:putative addiction module component (TIGR02574 family)
MNNQLTPEEVRQLITVEERLRLIEDVWISLSEAPEKVEVPERHRTELDARLAAHERDPSRTQAWFEAKADILRAVRK